MLIETASETGRVRARNEDAFLVDPELGLLVVADGVGGRPGGEVASRLAVSAIQEQLRDGGTDLPDVRDAISRAHQRLRSVQEHDDVLGRMATTVVVAVLRPEDGLLVVGNVGDSRAYLRTAHGLRRLTLDHAIGSRLTQALGGPYVPEPDVVEVPLAIGDLIVLVTDGVTDALDDAELAELLDGFGSPTARDRLVDAAMAQGGRDNVTVVVAQVLTEEASRSQAVGTRTSSVTPAG